MQNHAKFMQNHAKSRKKRVVQNQHCLKMDPLVDELFLKYNGQNVENTYKTLQKGGILVRLST